METGLQTNMSLHKKNLGNTDQRKKVVSFLQLGCTISLITINTWRSRKSASALCSHFHKDRNLLQSFWKRCVGVWIVEMVTIIIGWNTWSIQVNTNMQQKYGWVGPQLLLLWQFAGCFSENTLRINHEISLNYDFIGKRQEETKILLPSLLADRSSSGNHNFNYMKS